MVGLIITEENKQKNNLSQPVGRIITRNQHPNKWNGVENVVGGYRQRTDLHNQDGWFNVIIPEINEYQRLGILFFDEDNSVFTYTISDFNQDEIDNFEEEKTKNEAREKIKEHRDRADNILERTRTKIWRRVNKFPDGPLGLTRPQVAKLDRWFEETYISLLIGNFRQARNDINKVVEDRDGNTGDSTLLEAEGMLDVALWLQEQIQDYFDNQYDL